VSTYFAAKKGEVWRFKYRTSHPTKRRLGKVIGIRDTQHDRLETKTLVYHPLQRSRFLFHMVMDNGEYRSFYAEFIEWPEKVGWLERSRLWLKGVRFYPREPPVSANVVTRPRGSLFPAATLGGVLRRQLN
jgi:hypothetical protein